MYDTDAPDESGVVTDENENLSTSEDAPDESGVTPSEEAPAVGEDETEPAVKLEFKKLRDGQRAAEDKSLLLEQENRRLREAAEPAQEPEPEVSTGPPEYDDFEDPGEYHKAAADYEVRKAFAERDEKAEVQKQTDAKQEAKVKFNEGLSAAKEKHEDYIEVARVAEVYCSDEMVEQIFGCAGAHDIAYHLGQNPAEAKRIAGLSPLQQAREFGKLEARFGGDSAASTDTPEQNDTTKASPPAADLPTGGTDTDSTGKTTEEYADERRAKRAAGRGAAAKPTSPANDREAGRVARRAKAVKTG